MILRLNCFLIQIDFTNFFLSLRYMYTGELDLTKQLSEDILGLLVASDELLLEELFNYIQGYLIEKRTNWIEQNFDLILNTITKLANCEKLQDNCLELICANPLPLITSNNFSSLDKDILFDLLKRDDLQIEEIVIWDYLIKWGIEQTPGLWSKSDDKTRWNQETFEVLKKTLNRFIPLIRFVEISPADFVDKICPYETIIPHHIFKEVAEFYHKGILPKTINMIPRIASTIIKPKFATIIANWIDRNDSNVHSFNNKYQFNRIYLKSRDGSDCTTFHNKCNGQGPFVVLIKVQSKKIYGGYNPVGYALRNGEWLSSSDSFIFSFENDQGIYNMKIGRVINTTYSIYEDCNGYFLSFGWQLFIRKTSGQNLYFGSSGSYENIFNLDYNHSIEEIEVFSVVKK